MDKFKNGYTGWETGTPAGTHRLPQRVMYQHDGSFTPDEQLQADSDRFRITSRAVGMNKLWATKDWISRLAGHQVVDLAEVRRSSVKIPLGVAKDLGWKLSKWIQRWPAYGSEDAVTQVEADKDFVRSVNENEMTLYSAMYDGTRKQHRRDLIGKDKIYSEEIVEFMQSVKDTLDPMGTLGIGFITDDEVFCDTVWVTSSECPFVLGKLSVVDPRQERWKVHQKVQYSVSSRHIENAKYAKDQLNRKIETWELPRFTYVSQNLKTATRSATRHLKVMELLEYGMMCRKMWIDKEGPVAGHEDTLRERTKNVIGKLLPEVITCGEIAYDNMFGDFNRTPMYELLTQLRPDSVEDPELYKRVKDIIEEVQYLEMQSTLNLSITFCKLESDLDGQPFIRSLNMQMLNPETKDDREEHWSYGRKNNLRWFDTSLTEYAFFRGENVQLWQKISSLNTTQVGTLVPTIGMKLSSDMFYVLPQRDLS